MAIGMKNRKRIHSVLRIAILALVGVTVVFPFYILLIESLHPNLITMPYPVELWPKKMGLDNYALLFAQNDVGSWLINSLIIAGGTSALQAILCSMAAYGFGRTQFRGRKTLLSLLMVLLVSLYRREFFRCSLSFRILKCLILTGLGFRFSRTHLVFI